MDKFFKAAFLLLKESYVPRSAMVNLSVNVFGENLNLFEVGGRVEGLENTIEGMFGPEGHFKEDTLQKIFRQGSCMILSFLYTECFIFDFKILEQFQ